MTSTYPKAHDYRKKITEPRGWGTGNICYSLTEHFGTTNDSFLMTIFKFIIYGALIIIVISLIIYSINKIRKK